MAEVNVHVFIPCLVDQLYPEIGIATVRLLRHLGCKVRYKSEAPCCGQPAFNNGYVRQARTVAKTFIEAHASAECVVCPSGSCTSMVRKCYGELFEGSRYKQGADLCSKNTWELSQFLVNHKFQDKLVGTFLGKVGLHKSCHSIRQLGLTTEPRALFANIAGCEVVEASAPRCCGFGGLFCLKFDGMAAEMARSSMLDFTDQGAETIVSNDPGCIMHMRKEVKQSGAKLRIVHLAEFLTEAMKISEVAT